MHVIGHIRRVHEGLPADPPELALVEAEAEDYNEARDLAAGKVPDGWQVIAWVVPEHHPS